MTTTGVRTTRRFVFLALTLLAASALLFAVFGLIGRALDDHTSAAEQRFMLHVEQSRTSVVTTVAKLLSTIGSAGVLAAVAVAVAIVLVLRGLAEVAAIVVISTAGGIILPDLVKAFVDRPRPPVAHRLVSIASSSFPSGHAAQAAACLPALALAAIALGVSRAIAVTAAAIGVLAIGMSRVVLGVHYPSDVLAGWLLGGAWFVITVAAVRTWWPHPDRPSAPAAESST